MLPIPGRPRHHAATPWVTIVLTLLLGASCTSAGDASFDTSGDPAANPTQIVDQPAPAEESLVVGVLPFAPASQLDELYGPLVRELGRELGMTTRLRTAPSLDAYNQDLAAGEFDIAVVHPFEFVRLDELGYQPIARVESLLEATMVSSSDSGPRLDSLSDLVGLRVGTPPETSALRLLLDAELAAAGVAPTSLNLQAYRIHADCLGQLRLSTIDVCVVGPVPLQQFERETGEKLQALAFSEPIEGIAFVAQPDLDPTLVKRVQAFLLGLDENPETKYLLELVGTPRYVTIEDTDYERVRELRALATSE